MNRIQQILVIAGILLVFGMYFGLDTKPAKQKLVEKSRVIAFESLDIGKLIRDSKATFSQTEQDYLNSLESVAATAPDDSTKIEIYRKLSSDWYRKGELVIAGHYAELIAELDNTAERWSITGTTFGAALNQDLEQREQEYAFNKAVAAFENAISLDPVNLDHRINLAIMYADYPQADQPMKGIQLLLELNRQNPENVAVLYHLARFGMQTGQYERAIVRIEKGLELDPDNNRLICLAAEAYRGAGDNEKATRYQAMCRNKN